MRTHELTVLLQVIHKLLTFEVFPIGTENQERYSITNFLDGKAICISTEHELDGRYSGRGAHSDLHTMYPCRRARTHALTCMHARI